MEVMTPLPFQDLPTKPPLTGRIRISEDMQQSLALLSAYDSASRRLIRCTETGILQTVNPLTQSFINITGNGANYAWQGSAIKCTEVVVRAGPDNAGRVWANVYAAAAADTGWPLDANESIPITITKLEHLQLLIVTDGDKVIIEYTL